MQFFSTEGYPVGYHNNQSCSIQLVAPPGERVAIVIRDFDLEEGYDFLRVGEYRYLLDR